jgi:acetyl esterase/lipase
MFDKIIAFFMSIIAFFMGLFGGGAGSGNDGKPVTPSGANYTQYVNLAYGENERQKLDLCIPNNASGDLGLILFIHGGAWISGDKEPYVNGTISAAKDYGIAGAALNYHYISDSVHMDTLMNDIDLALTKIKAIGDERGVNINKVLLTGDSAGAHLSLLYAYSKADTAPIKPVAVISNSGPTDFTDENFYINNALGGPEVLSDLFSKASGVRFTYEQRASAEVQTALQKYSPLFYVNENTVPTIINHGDKDTIVPYSNAVNLDAKLTEMGVPHYFNTFVGGGHGLDDDKAASERANNQLFEYVNTYLK